MCAHLFVCIDLLCVVVVHRVCLFFVCYVSVFVSFLCFYCDVYVVVRVVVVCGCVCGVFDVLFVCIGSVFFVACI